MLFDQKLKPFCKSATIYLDPIHIELLEILESLWVKYQPFAPSNFQSEILKLENKHHALMWEMILGCKFIDHGYNLILNLSEDRPDIGLKVDEKTVWVECTIPQRGDVPELPYDGTVSGIDYEANGLRASSAIWEKYNNQYKSRIERGICDQEDAYIIALNGRNLDLGIYENMPPDICKVLFGINNLNVSFNVFDKENTGEVFYDSKSHNRKDDERLVPTTFFLKEDHKAITGILYSTDWITRYSSHPQYSYVQNPLSNLQTDFGLGAFMQICTFEERVLKLRNP